MTIQPNIRFFTLRSITTAVGILVMSTLLVVGCDSGLSGPELADPADKTDATLGAAKSTNGAVVERATFPFPFGPVPLSAPCLNNKVDTAPSIGGIWMVHLQKVETASGREHFNELLDYADVQVTAGDLTWLPGPGAKEKIVFLRDASGRRNVAHEFHARYISQDGLPDLRVYHSVHITVGPDGTTRHFEFTPFSATCLGSGP